MLARLAKILQAQAQKGHGDLGMRLSLGGVAGAAMHCPELDITAAPRLDLCVHGGDDSFVRELDAGLVETQDPLAHPVLVLHRTLDLRREQPGSPGSPIPALYGRPDAGPIGPASIVDCYADLLELGCQAEAFDFAMAMTRRARGT